ncbi:hypothetical protein [Carbonactinospora thermoautotrophica]|uniref:hypothetical protein n=1 Tax=Carbonactinospora thermoautotrophica TaxID=1469144 RepID=UPI00226D9A4B|nr:hypothetical protein [Carbonactinospora thermoautotrophica]
MTREVGPEVAALEETLEEARKVADAVLYEGYVLYPYRASAHKNQLRWQFGVLAPPAYAEERSAARTECLLEPGGGELTVWVRFLQVVRRAVEEATGDGFRAVPGLEVDGRPLLPWDEARAVEVTARVPVATLLPTGQVVPIDVPGGQEYQAVTDASGTVRARLVRTCWPLRGEIRVSAQPLPGPYEALRLRVEVENRTDTPDVPGRDEALRHALLAQHTLLAVTDGVFLSLLDPPEWAKPAAEACRNDGTWPVLVGPPERPRVVLSIPIILEDFPRVAPESPGDLYDATEIDEILTLRTMALTEEEKREARATDERAAQVIEQTDQLPPEVLERLHGAVRYLRQAGERPRTPWWDPGADRSVSPQTDSLVISGVRVARGSRVLLRPGRRRADAQDMFLAGRVAVVQGVFHDVDDIAYLAVTLEDDPAAELEIAQGRFRYYLPEEVEPL